MKNFGSHARRFWHLYALLVISIVVLAIARYLLFPKSFDWPAWVQAVGSIAAILVAVWVTADQAEQQRLRDLDRETAEVAGVLRSILAEVEMTWIYLANEMEPHLQVRKGEPIQTVFSLPEYPFPIFDALIPKLGTIPSAQLQVQIIRAFTLAKSLAMTAETHNGLVGELSNAESNRSSLNGNGKYENALRALLKYDTSLRTSFDLVRTDLIDLRDALRIVCAS